MRISDWSSDVCSSDLCDAVTDRPQGKPGQSLLQPESHGRGQGPVDDRDPARGAAKEERAAERAMDRYLEPLDVLSGTDHEIRSEERREGKEGVGAGSTRVLSDHLNKNTSINHN